MSEHNPSRREIEDTRRDVQSRAHRFGKRSLAGKSVGGIAIVVLVGLYALARPIVNERMGWDLPELRQATGGQVSVVDDTSPAAPKATKSTSSESDRSKTSGEQPGMSTKARGPLADRMRPSADANTDASSRRAEKDPSAAASSESDLLYGLLKEIGPERYLSPEGLLYTPGSAEGHRLEHLRRHTKDQPSRPGSHGVFDGDMTGALKTVDRAYLRAKKGQRTTKSVDDGRTIYTVDMGGRVGYVGGRDGNRRRKPMARRVRLVLEGTRVITAYPL